MQLSRTVRLTVTIIRAGPFTRDTPSCNRGFLFRAAQIWWTPHNIWKVYFHFTFRRAAKDEIRLILQDFCSKTACVTHRLFKKVSLFLLFYEFDDDYSGLGGHDWCVDKELMQGQNRALEVLHPVIQPTYPTCICPHSEPHKNSHDSITSRHSRVSSDGTLLLGAPLRTCVGSRNGKEWAWISIAHARARLHPDAWKQRAPAEKQKISEGPRGTKNKQLMNIQLPHDPPTDQSVQAGETTQRSAELIKQLVWKLKDMKRPPPRRAYERKERNRLTPAGEGGSTLLNCSVILKAFARCHRGSSGTDNDVDNEGKRRRLLIRCHTD